MALKFNDFEAGTTAGATGERLDLVNPSYFDTYYQSTEPRSMLLWYPHVGQPAEPLSLDDRVTRERQWQGASSSDDAA